MQASAQVKESASLQSQVCLGWQSFLLAKAKWEDSRLQRSSSFYLFFLSLNPHPPKRLLIIVAFNAFLK